MFDTNLFRNIKTPQDFAREEQEFQFRKRQQEMQQKMGDLQMQELQKKISTPDLPYQGTGLETQLINQKYLANLQSGMNQQQALQNATDTVLQSQATVDARGNTIRRGAIFGQAPRQINQMAPQAVMGMPTQQPIPQMTPQITMPPVDTGAIGVQTPSVPMSPIPTQQSIPTINPADFGVTSPYAIEDIAKKQAEAAITLNRDLTKENIQSRPAKVNFDRELANVLDAVNELKDLGAGVRTNQPIGQNILSRARSTQVGQGAEQFIGTREQELRDFIDSKRPVLFNAIKKASGLTGAELNSQFEVENQLKQLGNDKINIDTRMQILRDLSNQFGLGIVDDFRKYEGKKQRLKYNPTTGRLE